MSYNLREVCLNTYNHSTHACTSSWNHTSHFSSKSSNIVISLYLVLLAHSSSKNILITYVQVSCHKSHACLSPEKSKNSDLHLTPPLLHILARNPKTKKLLMFLGLLLPKASKHHTQTIPYPVTVL